jgi:multiple sugar transport system substrate-binding protein
MTHNEERVRTLIEEANRLRYSRRQIFRSGAALGLSSAGIATVLGSTRHASAAPRATRYIQGGGKLTILAGSYFVPEAQDFFVQQVTDWGSQNNTEVTCDFINWPDIQARITAAVESGSGPDIVELREAWQYLYFEQMVDLNDLAMQVGETAGGYYDWVLKTASVDGNYYSLPVGTSASAFAYRISYFEEAGIADAANNFPKTWEELFAVGKTLKEMGKPLGQALGHSTGDPPSFAYPYMWAYGAMEVEEDGKTVAFNKPEFVEGMNTFIQAWKDGYDETGLSWDDGVNNRAFLSDQISGTFNGSSVYIAAVNAAAGAGTTDFEVVVDPADITHGGFPEGPAGRFNQLNSMSYGLMSYSENQEAAKALLEHWTSTESFTAWLEAQKGYIIPPASSYASNPVYTSDPKLAPYLETVDYGRNKGYAGPANQKAAQAGAQYIVVDTFAKAIQNNDAAGAIEEGARLLERIYSR